MHPSTGALLGYFEYKHLPPELQEVSRLFHELAHRLAAMSIDGNPPTLGGPELTVALRKLLEAKDCAVRAAL